MDHISLWTFHHIFDWFTLMIDWFQQKILFFTIIEIYHYTSKVIEFDIQQFARIITNVVVLYVRHNLNNTFLLKEVFYLFLIWWWPNMLLIISWLKKKIFEIESLSHLKWIISIDLPVIMGKLQNQAVVLLS